MSVPMPHYLLFSEARGDRAPGHWRFVLRSADGPGELVASDKEPGVRGERLDLLTVVRALEALDQPSRVTLVDCSRYVRQGMRYGLSQWRTNGWRWECFGQMVPVRNGDLWQRLDRAMCYHNLDWRSRRLAALRELPGGANPVECRGNPRRPEGFGIRVALGRWLECRTLPMLARCRRRTGALVRLWRKRFNRSWTARVSGARAG